MLLSLHLPSAASALVQLHFSFEVFLPVYHEYKHIKISFQLKAEISLKYIQY